MKPQSPPPKPFAVARIEAVYSYHDTKEEADEEYADHVRLTFPFGDGVMIELWDATSGEWVKVTDREFPPMPVNPENT